jgi:pimeloyl-ACP methyl ester carboxylesterase
VAFIEIRHKKIHLLTLPCAQKEKPIVIFLHGLLIGSSAGWYFHIATEVKKYCHVALFDFPGHGLSEKTKSGYQSQELILDLEQLIPYLIEYFDAPQAQIYLIGHSYGAWVSLNYALQHHHAIKALGLIELPLPPTLDRLSLDPQNPLSLIDALPKEILDLLKQGKRVASKLIETLKFLLLESELLEALSTEKDISDLSLQALDLPVLLIYAQQSPCQSAVNRLLQNLKSVTYHLISGGHFILNEHPQVIASLIVDFIVSIENHQE